MPLPPKIVLVGPMGAGKTTIGRHLARKLGYEFNDSDRELEFRTGANIPWIFDVEGESGFRDRESRVIEELLAQDGVVVATGGGAVLRPENRETLGRALVIYLKVPPGLQYERTRRDRNRPLLQSEDPRSVLERLFRERDPLYAGMADIVVEGGKRSPRSLVRRIVSELKGEVHNGEIRNPGGQSNGVKRNRSERESG